MLWPARLHHLRRDSSDPKALARFYGELLGDRVESLPDGSWLVQGHARRMIIGKGEPASVPWFALALRDAAQLAAYAATLQKLGVKHDPSPSPLFDDGAFAVTDPDGRQVAFGVPRR
ncbi:MAG: VOC family protein, partial [Burkholderiales bacterium]